MTARFVIKLTRMILPALMGIFILLFCSHYAVAQDGLYFDPAVNTTKEGDLYFDPSTTPEQDSKPRTYYEQCVDDPQFDQSYETHMSSCACLAAYKKVFDDSKKIEKAPSVGTVQERTAGYIPDEKRFFAEVFGPCLHIPMRETVYNECYFSKFYQDRVIYKRRLKNYCNCKTDGVASYLESYAVDRLKYIYAKGESIDNPLEAMLQDSDYQKEFSRINSACYRKYATD